MSEAVKKLHPGLAVLAVAEILIGLVAAGIGVYILMDTSNCNANAEFCRPLGMIVVVLLLVPGCVVAAFGALSFVSRRFPFWTLQLAMVGMLILYYGSLLGVLWILGAKIQ